MSYVLGLKSQIDFGKKYKGMYVNTVVEMDPKWVLFVAENHPHHKFNRYVLARAQKYVNQMGEKPVENLCD